MTLPTDYNLIPQDLKALALHAISVAPKGFVDAVVKYDHTNGLVYGVKVRTEKRIVIYSHSDEEVLEFGKVMWYGLQNSAFQTFELTITPNNTTWKFGGIISNAEDLNAKKDK